MISASAPGQENCRFFFWKSIWFLTFLCWNACKHNMFGMILTWFGMNARVCTLWYFLQWIIAVDDRTSIASAPRGDMTSLDLTKFLRFLWFSYDFSKSARGRNLQNFWWKTIGFLRFLCWNACKHWVFGRILTWKRAWWLYGIFCKGLLKFAVLR